MSDTRQLFGGAITATLPHTLIDASDIRQVPDTQEVFLYPDSGTSIIVEVLQRVAANDADEAARFHFESLAHDNSATESKVLGVDIHSQSRGDTPPPIVLRGTQSIPKFNSTTPDEVNIFLALYRVQSKGVDLVLSMNVPTKTSDGGAVDTDGISDLQRDFDVAATSLQIVDFGLFV